ncbi:MAG: amidohydrolase family protein [Oscillospiraceae bacterium]|nr:amidohydrolase family protein [Oscillospiraceae bacterium]
MSGRVAGKVRNSMLGDCHIHMVLDGILGYREAMDRHRSGPDDAAIRKVLAQYQKAGMTFLRDGGDKFGAAARAAVLAPEYGLTYVTPVFPIFESGRYGAFIGMGFSDLREFRELLAEVKRQGAQFLKLMLSGLVDFQEYGRLDGDPMAAETIRELIHIGHEEGLSVMAHCNGDAPAQAALEAGVDSLEHGYYLGQETLHQLAESDTVWVPTVVTVGNLIHDDRYPQSVTKRILDEHLWKVGIVAGWGGNVALGSDAGAYLVPHVQGALDEYDLLKEELGEHADSVLRTGEDMIRWKFGGLS